MIPRLALAALAVATLASCASRRLEARLEAVEFRVAALEGRSAAPAPAPATPAIDLEIRTKMAEVNDHLQKGDVRAAAAACADGRARFGTNPGWRGLSRTCDDLAVIGKPAVEFQVESWFQSAARLGPEPTLIVFFETWCPHCRREVPRLQQIHGNYAGRLSVVAVTKVNRTSTDEAVRDFIAEHALTFPVGKERGGLMSEYYAVSGIPAAVLLKNGEVAWRGHPARLDDAMIDRLLAP